MHFSVKLTNREKTYEFFDVCIRSIQKWRLIPSVYRHPHLSARWLFVNVSFSGLNRLEPASNT